MGDGVIVDVMSVDDEIVVPLLLSKVGMGVSAGSLIGRAVSEGLFLVVGVGVGED